MTDSINDEQAVVTEEVLVKLSAAPQLRSMDGRAASRFLQARRLVGTGGRPVALSGCTSFVQPFQEVVTLAGLTDVDGFPLDPKAVFRVEAVIYDPERPDRELFSQSLVAADVLTAYWQPWSEDEIGFNFRHAIEGTFFAKGGVGYPLAYFFYLIGRQTFRVDNRVYIANVQNSRPW